jgi:hypothetical protein
VYTIAWDPEHANWIATGSNDQTIKFIRFDTDSGTRINVNSGTVRSIVATSSSTIFAGCSGDTLLRRFDIERHDVLVANWSCPMSKPNGSTTYINSLSIDVKDYKSQLVLVSLSNGIASLIDPRTSGAIWQVSGCSSPAVGKLYGEKILVARESGTVTMYDKRSNSSPVWEYDVRTTCRSVDLTCELVAVAGFDGTIRLLKTSDGSISHELSGGHADRIVHVSWSPDSYLVSCGTDSQTVLWRRDSAPNR